MKKSKYLLALEQIERKNNGIITPHAVVAEAESPLSPLHECFEWDDEKAGHEYRLFQARHLITRVRVNVKDRGEQQYYNAVVRVGDSEQQGYVNRDRVKSEDEIYAQVVTQAAQEIIYWKKKYSSIKELRGIINDVELEGILERFNHYD